MPDDTVSLLKIHDYFRGLSEEILVDVGDQTEVIQFDTGDCVHEANTPFTHVDFLVRGRLKTVKVDDDGRESLFRFTARGEQLGMVSAALPEPVPLRVIAVEPSVVLRLPYEAGLQLTVKYPELRHRWNENLAGSLRKVLLGEQTVRGTKVLTMFHQGSSSRDLVGRLIKRLVELGEKPCLLSDDPTMHPAGDVPFCALIGQDGLLSPEQVRQQLAQWPDRNRIVFDVSANMAPALVDRIVENSEHVLWCAAEENAAAAALELATMHTRSPAFRDRISLVWCLKGRHIAPAVSSLRQLVARQFVLSDAAAQIPLGQVVCNGLERLIHFLRGIQIGLALGGGAARGMAHLGVLKVLEESGIVVDMISGTSAGAMTGILYGSGLDADYTANRFTEDLKPSWIFRLLPRGGHWFLLLNYRRGLFDPMLRKYLDDTKLEQLPIPCSAVTVDLVSGEAVVRDSGDAVQAILESINLPVLSKPLFRDGQALIDGGFLNNVPADVLVSKGCNFVIAVDVTAKIEYKVGTIEPDTPADKARSPSTLETLLRTYTILSHSMTAVGAAPADVTIQPDVSTFDMTAFTRALEAADIGKRSTREQLPTLRKLLHRLDGALFPEERQPAK